jgi:hypothetical protein
MRDGERPARLCTSGTPKNYPPDTADQPEYHYFSGNQVVRTPSSVGPMLAMKRLSWHYTIVAALKDGAGSHCLFIVNDRESTRNAVRDYSNGFDRTRLSLLTRAGGS